MNTRSNCVWPLVAAFFASLQLLGCGSPSATVERWQREVRSHVAVAGRGDVNVLRNTPQSLGRPVFTSLGGKDPQSTDDFIGVLLGQAPVGTSQAMVFLLARVERRVPRDVRIALVYDDGGNDLRPTVKLGPVDPLASRRYADRYKAAQTVDALWPAPSDIFDWRADGQALTVTEKTSGISWEMQLPKP